MSSDPDPAPVVIHASLRGFAGAVVTPLALLALGIAALATAGAQPVPILLAVTGAGLAAVTMLDFPRHTVFDASGMTRVCVARRHHLAWARVVAIRRARPTSAARLRHLTGGPPEGRVSGGLVAHGAGRRRWLLTDRVESRLEYDRLHALMSMVGTATQLSAPRPHERAAPSNLHRRRRARNSEPSSGDGTG